MCYVQFTYVLIPTLYVRVDKFLEKVIIERNSDLKSPLECRRERESDNRKEFRPQESS